eukprot:TRINITY_DN1871_c0_g1_i1.p1 TRINITY_DN1871_c0_g1~~TRINITY_DN1871_c0_g1_i1.p1  ORF type:complete len:624 (-),score=98.87 TRINITY_DN1871_c0_g1_i1:588-2459(-)
MPTLPCQAEKKQGPVLLGTANAQVNFRVKNTFIDGPAEDDDGTVAAAFPSPSGAKRHRHHTCPGPASIEEDSTPSGVHSRNSTGSCASAETLNSSNIDSSCRQDDQDGKHVFFHCPEEAGVDGQDADAAPYQSIRVKNTFIDTADGNWTPAARRRNQTCPPEETGFDETPCSEDENLMGGAAWANATANSSPIPTQQCGTGRQRISNRKLPSGASSPVACPSRAALVTDLWEKLAETPDLHFAPSSPAGRPRTRNAFATEDLREDFAQRWMMSPQSSPLVLPAPLTGHARLPLSLNQELSPTSAANTSPTSFPAATAAEVQNCPPGYVPYATAAAAVAAASMITQQQMTFAATMSAGLLWPWRPPAPPALPPPSFPPANICPTPPNSAHGSPACSGWPVAGASLLGLGSTSPGAAGPFVQQAATLGTKPCATTQALVPGLISERLEQGKHAPDEADVGGTNRRGPRRQRLWAHIYLHMQLEGFDLVPRLIGRGGCNMRKIAEATGAKVRIRGRGSGHLEIEGNAEAPTPLMVAVTTDHADPAMFKKAIEMIIRELKAVEGRFNAFCQKQSHAHVGPCYSIGVLQPNAMEALADLLDSIPHSSMALNSSGKTRSPVAVGAVGED